MLVQCNTKNSYNNNIILKKSFRAKEMLNLIDYLI